MTSVKLPLDELTGTASPSAASESATPSYSTPAVQANAKEIALFVLQEFVDSPDWSLDSYPVVALAGDPWGHGQQIVDAINSSIKEQRLEVRKENASLAGDSKIPAEERARLRIDLRVELSTPDLFLVKVELVGSYALGAHGFFKANTMAYNPQTGKAVRLQDAIDDWTGFADLLTKSLGDQGEFELDFWSRQEVRDAALQPKHWKDWTLDSYGGIFITFPEYSVGPYSSGTPTVYVSAENLRKVAVRDSWLVKYIDSHN